MKSKLKFLIPLVMLAALGGAYTFTLAGPEKAAPVAKVDGELYVLPREFLVNLESGRYAQLTVALVLPHPYLEKLAAEGEEPEAPEPPAGFGSLGQEALVRDIVTDELSGAPARRILRARGRDALRKRILRAIGDKTDIEADDVLFTDVTVQ